MFIFTTVCVLPDDQLYSGTVADFTATDSLIIKERIRTEQYDYKQLNGKNNGFILIHSMIKCENLPSPAPDFVNALEDDDHVYFFFRESAVEFINCGKVSARWVNQWLVFETSAFVGLRLLLGGVLAGGAGVQERRGWATPVS